MIKNADWGSQTPRAAGWGGRQGGSGAGLSSRGCFDLLCIPSPWPGLPRGCLDHAGVALCLTERCLEWEQNQQQKQLFVVFFLLSRGTGTAVGQSCTVLAPPPSIKDPPSSASPAFLPSFHDLYPDVCGAEQPQEGSSCSGQLLPAALCSSCCVHSALPGELQLLDTGGCQEKDEETPSCAPEPFPA